MLAQRFGVSMVQEKQGYDSVFFRRLNSDHPFFFGSGFLSDPDLGNMNPDLQPWLKGSLPHNILKTWRRGRGNLLNRAINKDLKNK